MVNKIWNKSRLIFIDIPDKVDAKFDSFYAGSSVNTLKSHHHAITAFEITGGQRLSRIDSS